MKEGTMKLTKAALKSLIKKELLKESSGMGMSGGRDLKTVDELVEELSEIHRQLHEFIGFGVATDPKVEKLYQQLGDVVAELQERF